MGIVYLVRNKSNDKQYVGLTTAPLHVRWRYHVRASKHNCPRQLLAKAIKKYGPENFELSVIEECSTNEQLREREKYWIEKIHTFVDFGGYNMTKGGDGLLGYRHTPTAKKSMSEKHKGELNHNFGKNWGFKWDEESKQKMSKERKDAGNPMFGKKHSKEARKKITDALHKRVRKTNEVSQMTLNGVVLKIFESAKLAAFEVSGSESKISDCCRGGRKTHKGYMWCYSSPQKGE